MKIGVIGAGAVGSACLLSIVMGGAAREIVVVNRDRKRATAVATDLQYGASLSPVIDIRDGDYSDLRMRRLSWIIIVLAGVFIGTGDNNFLIAIQMLRMIYLSSETIVRRKSYLFGVP